MPTEIVKAPSVDISLSYPDNLPAAILRGIAIPAAIQTVAELAKAGIVATSVVVEAFETTKVKIAYYREYGRYVREDIIPVVALADAHQWGRDQINSMGLDDDLRGAALQDLERKRQQRRNNF